MSDTATAQVIHVYSETPAKVFDAWLNAEDIRLWMFGPSDIVRTVEIDASPEGKFRFSVTRDGQKIDHVGQYEKIDRPRQLTFTWEVPAYSDQSSQVSISLTAIGTGTKLTLTHRGILPEYEEATQAGWARILGRLDDYFQADEEL